MAAYTFNTDGNGVREAAALSLTGSAGGTDYVWVNHSDSVVTVDYTLSAAGVSVSIDNGVSIRERAGTRAFTAVFPARSGGIMTVTGTGNFGVIRPVIADDATARFPVKAVHGTVAANTEVIRFEATVA